MMDNLSMFEVQLNECLNIRLALKVKIESPPYCCGWYHPSSCFLNQQTGRCEFSHFFVCPLISNQPSHSVSLSRFQIFLHSSLQCCLSSHLAYDYAIISCPISLPQLILYTASRGSFQPINIIVLKVPAAP